jgi:hypothetical protein
MTSFKDKILPPKGSLWAYCLLAGFSAFVAGNISYNAVRGLAALIGIAEGSIPSRQLEIPEGLYLLGAILFAPVTETLVLAAGIGILLRLGARRSLVVVAAAIAAGAAHGPFPLTFAFTVTAFAVFAFGYVIWREVSVFKALVAAGIPHALSNMLVVLLVYRGA